MVERAYVERALDTVMALDVEGTMALFADDALLFDPHYPVPAMKGKAAIRQGLEWGMGSMQKMGFVIRGFWTTGDSAVVETDTHHVLKGGMKLDFPQVFVIETCDGKISRWQSYVPYPAPGIGGLLAKLTRCMWRLQGRIK